MSPAFEHTTTYQHKDGKRYDEAPNTTEQNHHETLWIPQVIEEKRTETVVGSDLSAIAAPRPMCAVTPTSTTRR